MTAKEKAKELVDRFIPKEESIEFAHVKQCALICVDEILDNQYDLITLPYKAYWQEVRQEIELLKK